MFGDCTDIITVLVDFREYSCGEGVRTVEQDVLEGLFHVLLPHSFLLLNRVVGFVRPEFNLKSGCLCNGISVSYSDFK